MKTTAKWYSQRLQRDVRMVRWGTFGQPVLCFPTAGGDFEEIERFLMIKVLSPLIDAGRIKLYSCDSIAGMAMVQQEGSGPHRQWVLNQFHQYIRHELVPAVRTDCENPNIELISTGASIGAFHAAAVICRFPDVFSKAICMSGTFDIRRFMKSDRFTDDYWVSSPLHFVPTLKGPHLDKLRERFILIPSGEGKAEDISESWALAKVLGRQGIPNRVDSWGKQTPHDWMTWREMLPKYLDQLVK
ncbi:MAG: alpha/beta hydrolase-fold protein [Archangium sp.]